MSIGCSVSSIHCFHELVIPGVSQVQDKVALNAKEETTHHEADSSPDVVELVWDEITHDVEDDQDKELHTPETIMEGTTASSSWENSDQNKYVEAEKGKTRSESS